MVTQRTLGTAGNTGCVVVLYWISFQNSTEELVQEAHYYIREHYWPRCWTGSSSTGGLGLLVQGADSLWVLVGVELHGSWSKEAFFPALLWNSRWWRGVLLKDTLTETKKLNLHVHACAISMYCQTLSLPNILPFQMCVLFCAIFICCLYLSVLCCSVVYVHIRCHVDFVIKALAPAKSTREL